MKHLSRLSILNFCTRGFSISLNTDNTSATAPDLPGAQGDDGNDYVSPGVFENDYAGLFQFLYSGIFDISKYG